MTPESDQKIPPLSNEAGRLWRSQQAPADIAICHCANQTTMGIH